MSVIKETIKFNNLDMNLTIPIGSGIGFTGYQQEVDNLTLETENELINPVIDTEVRKFNYAPIIQPSILYFYFHLSTDEVKFTNAGFTQTEIDNSDTKLLNSFFILDFYDTYDTYTQTKIFTTYLTKVLGSNNNTPQYTISSSVSNQFYNWYVPLWYIDLMRTSGTTVTGYTKFSFYNAKDGSISLFYNHDNVSLKTPEKMYFKSILNLVDMTWRFTTTSFPNIRAYELYNAAAYTQRVNNTLVNFDNKKQNYPSGNTFITLNGSYTTV
jgi:hypothetical protein